MSSENQKTIDTFAAADAAEDPGPDSGSVSTPTLNPTTESKTESAKSPTGDESAKSPEEESAKSPTDDEPAKSPVVRVKSPVVRVKSPQVAPGGAIENLKAFDPFAEADEAGDQKAAQYIHIRIQQRNGRKTLTTVQGLPKKFDRKKILKVIKKKFACNGTIVSDLLMGDVIQLQGDQRKDVQTFLTAQEGLGLDVKTIKVHGF